MRLSPFPTFFIAALAALLGAPALAADVAVKAPPPAPAVSSSWTGCYLGIEGGGNWGTSHHTGVAAPFAGFNVAGPYDLSGGLFGGTIGCNYQADRWVFGIEGDDSWTNTKGITGVVAPFNPAYFADTKERWIGTLRGRIGWTMSPQTLIYATGGAAFGRIAADNFSPTFGTGVSDAATLTGYVVGGGIESMLPFWQNVSAKAEFLYVDYGTHTFFNPPITPGNCVCIPNSIRTEDYIFRLGLNYHFNLSSH
jgi:outer membrane immunogenic protein